MFTSTAHISLAVLLFVIGAVFGSFGNVLIYRIPKREKITGRSKCPLCKHTLSVLDLFPIVGFVFLGGKCRYCKGKISKQYPIVEIVSGLLFVSVSALPLPLALLLGLALWLLFVIAYIDARTETISDTLNASLFIIAVLWSSFTGSFDLLAIVVAVGFLGLQCIVSGGRWVGTGDVFLIASISLIVGKWQNMLLCLFLTYIIGAAYALILLITGEKKRTDTLPFAPFLGVATLITLFFGEWILRIYGL